MLSFSGVCFCRWWRVGKWDGSGHGCVDKGPSGRGKGREKSVAGEPSMI